MSLIVATVGKWMVQAIARPFDPAGLQIQAPIFKTGCRRWQLRTKLDDLSWNLNRPRRRLNGLVTHVVINRVRWSKNLQSFGTMQSENEVFYCVIQRGLNSRTHFFLRRLRRSTLPGIYADRWLLRRPSLISIHSILST